MSTDIQAVPFADIAADVADGSTITDAGKLAEIAEGLVKSLKQGLTSFRALSGIHRKCAIGRVQARSLILTAKGTPDWSAKSDTYRLTVAAQEETIWATATTDEKRKSDAAIRQQISRSILEPAITNYVLSTLDGIDPRTLRWTEGDADTSVLTGDIPAKLKQAIAAQYKSADLTVPEKFGGPAKGSGQDGRKDKDAASALSAMEDLAVHAIAKTGEDGGPSFASVASGIHATASALLVALSKSGEVQDRPVVVATVGQLAEIVGLIGKTLDGKVTPEEIEAAPLYVPSSK